MAATMEWGSTPSGDLVYIRDAKNGRNCGLLCVGCGQPLLARQGKVRQWHFSHDAPDSNSGGACEGYLHILVKIGLAAYISDRLNKRQPGFPVEYSCSDCSETHMWHVARSRWEDWGNPHRQLYRDGRPTRAALERSTSKNRPDISLLNDADEVLSTIEVVVGNLSDRAGALGKPALVIRPVDLESLPEMARDWPPSLQLQYLIEGAILRGASERGHSALNAVCAVCDICKQDVSRRLVSLGGTKMWGGHYRCPICAAHHDPSDDDHQCPSRYLSGYCGICKEDMGTQMGLEAHMAFEHGMIAKSMYNGINPSYLWHKIGKGDWSTALVQWGNAIPISPTHDEWLDWELSRHLKMGWVSEG